jgi:hypothetical protein
MLDLIAQAAQRDVTEPGGLAAISGGVISKRAIAKPLGNAAQCCSDGLAQPVGGPPRTG